MGPREQVRERRGSGGGPRTRRAPVVKRPRTQVRVPMYYRLEETVEGEPATIGRLVRALLCYDTAVQDEVQAVPLEPDAPFRRFAWDGCRWPRGDWERFVRDDDARKAARARGEDPDASGVTP